MGDNKAVNQIYTPVQAESLLYSLKQATGGIGLNVYYDKTDFVCFKQEAISTLNNKPLKLVDPHT